MATSDDAFESAWQEAHRFPATYKIVRWVRVASTLFAIAFIAGWNYVTFYPPYANGAIVFNPVLVGVDAFITLAMLYLVWWAFTAQITLTVDSIEKSGPLGTHVYQLNDIAGRRFTSGRVSYPLIVLKSGNAISIDTTSYGMDDRFDLWFRKLPDIKAFEERQEREHIENDPSLGATAAERLARSDSRDSTFMTLAIVLMLPALALFIFSLQNEALSGEVVLAAAVLPWCAILLMLYYRDRVLSVNGGKALAPLMMVLLAPVGVLGVLAADVSGTVDSTKAILWGAVAGLPFLFFLIYAMTNRGAKGRQLWVLLLIMAPYAWIYGGGSLTLANALLDKAPVPIYRTQVTDRFIVSGRSSSHHYLLLAPWGPLQATTKLLVEGDQYYATKKGDVVCMSLHPGKFGLRWIHSAPCP